MATTIASAPEPLVGTRRPELAQEKKIRPVLFWAALGGLQLGVAIYAWARWLANLPAPTPVGVSKVPVVMLWSAILMQATFTAAGVFFLYWWVVRGWRRTGHLTWDGMFAISCLLLYWQNYLIDYPQIMSTYNSVLLNWGSWYRYVPGWTPPDHGHFVEAPLLAGLFYSWGILGMSMLFCFILRHVKARRPSIGKIGIIGVAIGIGIVLDLFAETIWLATGIYHYGGVPGPKIFAGHYYEFPVLELVLFGVAAGAFACMRYFTNDRGETFAERGIEEVRIGRKSRTFVRTLAIFGGLSTIFLAYNMAYLVPGLHATNWNEDILKRSYFTQGYCGAGTDRACSGPAVPVFRRNSVTIDPHGNVRGLEKLPKAIPSTKCPDSPYSAPLSGNC